MNISRAKTHARAFTLIELLVVIAIIGVLAALLMTALAGAKRRVVQIQCLANYKQVGVALKIYTDDHNDELPPGKNAAAPSYLDVTEAPIYNASLSNYLAYYLAPNLSLPSPSATGLATNYLVKVLACPGYTHSPPPGYDPESDNFAHAFSFTLTRLVNPPLDKLPGYPFGKRNQDQLPLRIPEIASAAPLAEVWVLADLDWLALADPTSLNEKYEFTAPKPVHRTTRNYLFFDFHVESKKVGDSDTF